MSIGKTPRRSSRSWPIWPSELAASGSNRKKSNQGTFSISNYGSFGSLLATPAINQPQAAILGLGAIHKAPVVIDDAIAIRSICYVTLSFDHRLLDGAVGDQFVSHLKGIIESWSEELL